MAGRARVRKPKEQPHLSEYTSKVVASEKKLNALAKRGVDQSVLQAELVREAIELKRSQLPHLYKFKWYPWAWDFFNTRSRYAFLTAANQIGKSTTLARLAIEWAGNPSLWPELWPMSPNARLFWWFSPSQKVMTREFEQKWIPDLLPQDLGKNHATYGWHATYTKEGYIDSVHFNSGVTIAFHTYMQQPINLQSATVWATFFDEEMPCDDDSAVNELLVRMRSTGGYLRKSFTATIGGELWYRTMERIGLDDEAFKGAWKRSVSLYDCQTFTDGSPSIWTPELIRNEEEACTTEAERLKRVMGRFVKSEGLQYAAFNASKHVVDEFIIPNDWVRYASVDLGGNQTKKRSKAAVIFFAVNPEMTKAYIYKTWRGDHERTTAGDVFDKYIEMRGDEYVAQKCYDYASADFYEIATRRNEAFLPGLKDRNAGIKRMNQLFHDNALFVTRHFGFEKVVGELMTVSIGGKESKQTDDLTDAIRYGLMLVPFNWSLISERKFSDNGALAPSQRKKPEKIDERREALEAMRARVNQKPQGFDAELEADINEWNQYYGS